MSLPPPIIVKLRERRHTAEARDSSSSPRPHTLQLSEDTFTASHATANDSDPIEAFSDAVYPPAAMVP